MHRFYGWLGPALFLLAATTIPAAALLEHGSGRCLPNEYWCQDRCGSDSYGQTCCETPTQGQHNLCGKGTICCGYGCCPQGSVCNAVGGCDFPGGPGGGTSPAGPSSGPGGTTSQPTSGGGSGITTGTSTWTSGGQTFTSAFTYTTDSSQSPPFTTSNTTGTSTWTSGSQTFTSTFTSATNEVSSSDTTTMPSPPASATTGTSVWTSGSKTFTSVFTSSSTGGVVLPPPGSATTGTSTWTSGSETFTSAFTSTSRSSVVSPPVNVTTGISTRTSGSPTFTSSSTSTNTGGSGVSPPVSTTTGTSTWTNGNETFTSAFTSTNTASSSTNPPSVGITTGVFTWTSGSLTFTSGFTSTNTGGGGVSPPVSATTGISTWTSGGQTFTSGFTSSSTGGGGGGGILPTYTSWPPEARISPVTTSVGSPEPTDGGTIVPCDLWFFSICVSSNDWNIGGWLWNLPPGIYPPGPPPPPAVGPLPSGVTIPGPLPPFPRITVGPNSRPTYSSEKPTGCKTESASICSTTTKVSASGTVTGPPQVSSTCATILGCSVSDSDGTTSRTATATSCETTRTATNAWVSCTGTAAGSGAGCSTLSSSVVSGCSATATTSTLVCSSSTGGAQATGQAAARAPNPGECERTYRFVVYPRDGTNTEQTSRIRRRLEQADVTGIEQADTRYFGVDFWTVRTTNTTAEQLRGGSLDILTIYHQCGQTLWTCPDPNAAADINFLRGDEEARWQTRWTSQPRGSKWQDPQAAWGEWFLFDGSAGQDVPVYVVDTGATLDNEEFTNDDDVRGRARWVANDPDLVGSTQHDDVELPIPGATSEGKKKLGHGTCVLSLVAGKSAGLAKRASPILARPRRRREDGGGSTPEDWIRAVSAAADDVVEQDRSPSGDVYGVLNMSQLHARIRFLLDGVDYSAGFRSRMHLLLMRIQERGIVIVTGSGNNGASDIDGWPANLGAPSPRDGLERVPGLLVVGALNQRGEVWLKTNSDFPRGLPHVYAPGAGVRCANGDRTLWDSFGAIRSGDGTSYASALTAGLAAYLIGLRNAGRLGDYDPGFAASLPDQKPDTWRRYVAGRASWSRSRGWPDTPFAGRELPSAWNLIGREHVNRDMCPYKPRGALAAGAPMPAALAMAAAPAAMLVPRQGSSSSSATTRGCIRGIPTSSTISSSSSSTSSSSSRTSTSTTSSSSSSTTSATTTAPPPPPPSPTARCVLSTDVFSYRIVVWEIEGWAEKDDGDKLRDEEEGCGALTDWKWRDAADGNSAAARFRLPTIIKAGCVERAIASAGGPEIDECEKGGVELPWEWDDW